MPKITRTEIVKLVSAVDNRTGEEYGKDNWRHLNVGGQGILLLAESLHKFPGRPFLYFFFTKLEDLVIPVLDDLKTGYGEIIKDDENEFIWKTRNSTYKFEYEGVTFSDVSRKILLEYGEHIAQKMEDNEKQKKKFA